jgi:quercetin dioxygenase-like cupin family protein
MKRTATSARIVGAARALCLIPMLALALMPESAAAQQPAAAPQAEVTPLMSKDLPEFPGKEVTMITVVYPPGSSDPIHRHNAHAFVYVLEGAIVMQVKGGKEVTVKPGETFYEGPNDVHIVGRNASTTEPAKFVVILIKDKGAPILTPVETEHGSH